MLKTVLQPVNLFFLFAIVASRFLPHPPNFTPVLAIFLLSGTLTILPMLITYMLTDVIIGYHSYMVWVYASLFAVAYLQKGPITSSVIFFLITNFAVWTSGFYGLTIEGLVTTYVMAIPFFINTLVSTVMFYYATKYVLNNSKNIDMNLALQK